MNKSQIELHFLYGDGGKQANKKAKTTTTTKPNQTKQQRKEISMFFLPNLANDVVLMMYIRSVWREKNSIIPQD